MKTPFIIGEDVYLRGITEEDIRGNYFQWFNDQEVCAFNSHGVFPNNITKMNNYLEFVNTNSTALVLAIITKKDDQHIGNISLQNIDWISKNAEFAIIIGEKQFWGKGYSKQAADLIIKHGFNTLNLQRIYCGTSEDNTGMKKLAEHMCMKKEGVRRKALYKNGKYKDIFEYGLLKEEYII